MDNFHAIYKCEKCGSDIHIMQRDTIEFRCLECGNMIFNSEAWSGGRNENGNIKYDGTLRRKYPPF